MDEMNPELKRTFGVMTEPELRVLRDHITALLHEPHIRRYPVATRAKARLTPNIGYPDR